MEENNNVIVMEEKKKGLIGRFTHLIAEHPVACAIVACTGAALVEGARFVIDLVRNNKSDENTESCQDCPAEE